MNLRTGLAVAHGAPSTIPASTQSPAPGWPDPNYAAWINARRGSREWCASTAMALRSLVRNILESYGYRVLQAGSGKDAAVVGEQHEGPIHLLLTDVVMPQMSGRELAGHLGPSHQEMRVLYMSGYTDDAVVHHGVLEPGVLFLQKPFTPGALARKVREALDAEHV